LQERGSSIVFDFPIVKAGLPTYDIAKCVTYITGHMNARGLDTEMVAHRSMRISWERALRTAKRQHFEDILEGRKRRREEKRKRRKQEEDKRKAADKGPPLPPNSDDPNDLFSIPSIQSLKSTADVLRHV
jgi:hypothetical protein